MFLTWVKTGMDFVLCVGRASAEVTILVSSRVANVERQYLESISLSLR